MITSYYAILIALMLATSSATSYNEIKGYKSRQYSHNGCCAPLQWQSRFNNFLNNGVVQRGFVVLDNVNKRAFTYVHQKNTEQSVFDRGEWIDAAKETITVYDYETKFCTVNKYYQGLQNFCVTPGNGKPIR